MKLSRLTALGAVLALALASVSSYAATCSVVGANGAAPVATLTFTAPTLNTDGTAIATPLTYNLYQSTTAGAEVKVASALAGSPIVVNSGLSPGGTYYFKLSVTDAHGTESALSNEGCKSFPASVPGTVTITIT